MHWLLWLHDRRRLWGALALAAALVIALGSLSPADELPQRLPWDKFNHFIGYAGLAGLVGLAGLRPWRTLLGVVAYGIVLELAQTLVPGRFGGDWADILANTLGAAAAVLALEGLRRGFIRGRA